MWRPLALASCAPSVTARWQQQLLAMKEHLRALAARCFASLHADSTPLLEPARQLQPQMMRRRRSRRLDTTRRLSTTLSMACYSP